MSDKNFLYQMIDSVIQNDEAGATTAFKQYITPKTQAVLGLTAEPEEVPAPDAPPVDPTAATPEPAAPTPEPSQA